MRVDGHDISDCLDCPMLSGLTDEQKRDRIRTDPVIARCLAARRSAEARAVRKRPGSPATCEARIDNIQGVDADGG